MSSRDLPANVTNPPEALAHDCKSTSSRLLTSSLHSFRGKISSINIKEAMKALQNKGGSGRATNLQQPNTLSTFYQTGNYPFKLPQNRFRKSAVQAVSVFHVLSSFALPLAATNISESDRPQQDLHQDTQQARGRKHGGRRSYEREE